VLYFIYRKHTPSKDQKLPEHKDNATNEENANTAVSSENHAANSGGFVDIEIGEKKGVKKVEEAQKKQDQTENKTREASTQQVQHN